MTLAFGNDESIKFTCMNDSNNQPVPSKNIYQQVTDYVVQELRKESIPWLIPWNGYGPPRNGQHGYIYYGWNSFYLNYITVSQQYETPFFLTGNQVARMGGRIRPRENGYPVIYCKRQITAYKALTGGKGETREKVYHYVRFVLSTYMVYNIAQTEHVAVAIPGASQKTEAEKLAACEALVQRLPNSTPIRHGGDYAKYFAGMDYIQMPHASQFENSEIYYQVLFRELIHFTGHPMRLNRNELQFYIPGDERYIKEELTGELGTAYLCAYTGIAQKAVDKQSYCSDWINRIARDKTLLIKAALQAQAAVNYMLQTRSNIKTTIPLSSSIGV
jgi:antirestriction protein ArdC